MSGVLPEYPVPVPTPYQSPDYGGSPYVSPGATGPAIPQQSAPLAGPTPSGGVLWTTGQITPRENVNTTYRPPTTTTAPTAPAPTPTNTNPAPTQPQAKQKIGNLDDYFTDPSGVRKTYRSGIAEGIIDEFGNILARPTGPSEEEINALFDPSNQYLSQAENQLRADLPSILEEIAQQYGLGKGTLDVGRQQALGQADSASMGATTRRTEAEDAQARLYNELSMGGQQRFGGASSAGEAYGALIGREQQRQAGTIAKDFGTAMREIETQKVNIEQQYTQSLKELDFQKSSATNQANRDFQSKLLEINKMKAQNEQAKREARLSALQDLKNQVFQINMQNAQFQQALYAQRQSAELELEMAGKQLSQYGNTAQDAYGTFSSQTPTTPQTEMRMGGSALAGITPALTGLTGMINRNKDEQFIGAVNPQRSIFDEIRGI